jgi:hypothetical protein
VSERNDLREGIKKLRAIGGCKPTTFRELMEIRYGSWEEYLRVSEGEDDAQG